MDQRNLDFWMRASAACVVAGMLSLALLLAGGCDNGGYGDVGGAEEEATATDANNGRDDYSSPSIRGATDSVRRSLDELEEGLEERDEALEDAARDALDGADRREP